MVTRVSRLIAFLGRESLVAPSAGGIRRSVNADMWGVVSSAAPRHSECVRPVCLSECVAACLWPWLPERVVFVYIYRVYLLTYLLESLGQNTDTQTVALYALERLHKLQGNGSRFTFFFFYSKRLDSKSPHLSPQTSDLQLPSRTAPSAAAHTSDGSSHLA